MIHVEIVYYLQAVVRYVDDSGVCETKAKRAGLETVGGLYAVCRAYARRALLGLVPIYGVCQLPILLSLFHRCSRSPDDMASRF
jgi:hypothetical protein